MISSRPHYTSAEINARANDLPGFVEPDEMLDMLERESTEPIGFNLWQAVLSTTVVSRVDGDLCVLTGTRTAEGNLTHVNVASTPTIRVSLKEAGLLLTDRVPYCLSGRIDPLRPIVSESLRPSVAPLPDNTDVLASRVGHLLALKLQLGQAFEGSRSPVGRTSLARCIVGFSYLDDNQSGEPMYEPIIMLGAIVGLNPEIARQIPEKTNSYSHLGWAPTEQYVHGVATKSLLEVIPSATPGAELEVCVRGLCNATSSTILSDPAEIQYHLTEDGVLPRF